MTRQMKADKQTGESKGGLLTGKDSRGLGFVEYLHKGTNIWTWTFPGSDLQKNTDRRIMGKEGWLTKSRSTFHTCSLRGDGSLVVSRD